MSFFIFGEKVGRWVFEKAQGIWTVKCQAMGQVWNGHLIAGVVYDNYTGSSIEVHSRCDDRKHVNRTFGWMIFDYPFNQLKVKRITGIISTANSLSQKNAEGLGFRRETTLSDYFPDGDGIVYVMRKEDCKWLRVRHEDNRIAA